MSMLAPDRLNGWQRLWLVFGLVYLTVVIALTIKTLPADLTINEYLKEDTVHIGGLDPKKPRSFVRANDQWVEVQALAHNPSTGEWIYLLDGKWSQPSLSLQHTKLPRPLSDEEAWLLRANQGKVVVFGVFLWLIPWVLLYGFGKAFAWVRDGFRYTP